MSESHRQISFGSIYLGIIIQNNDPTRKGRVKVYVPEVSPTIYKGWNELEDKTLSYKFFGKNINSSLTPLSGDETIDDISPVVEDLKIILPWSYVMMPILGDTSAGRYNPTTIQATTSDGRLIDETLNREDYDPAKIEEEKEGELNSDEIAEKPGHVYERTSSSISDPFSNPGNIGANNGNPYSSAYQGTGHSNKTKGSFSIPGVGSLVWVQFRNGNPQFPVIVGSSYGQDDFKEIYEIEQSDERLGGPDYPGYLDNRAFKDVDNIPDKDKRFRSKWTFNQRGATTEIINTEGRENWKTTHYSGSFFELANNVTTLFSTENFQQMVQRDYWSTIRGNKNTFVNLDSDTIVFGDNYRKVGSWQQKDLYDQWKEVVQPAQFAKSLFHIKRAANGFVINQDDYDGDFGGFTQTKNGSHRRHPILNHSALTTTNSAPTIRNGIVDSSVNETEEFITHDLILEQAGPTTKSFPPENRARGDVGEEVGNSYPLSSSSVGGQFETEPVKQQIPDLRKQIQETLTELERQMSVGGDDINLIAKNQVNKIGTTFNDLVSVRADNVGRELWNSVVMDADGAFESMVPGILLEPVPVEKFPGGSKHDTICDGWDVNVGSNGFNLKTCGVASIGSSILNIGAEQINIGTQTELNVSADAINLSARVLELHNKADGQVYMNSGLGVRRNTVLKGGLAVDGEMYVQHITAPAELNKTYGTTCYGKFNTEAPRRLLIGEARHTTSDGIEEWLPVYALPDDDLLYTYEHHHDYINLPLRLMQSNQLTRQQSIVDGINPGTNTHPLPSLPLNHARKTIKSRVDRPYGPIIPPDPTAEMPLG